ncbi:MAG TPA: GatB/YqeY domain-containing protein [Thiolapillus brandeum]|uniref:GatB/YqeY domain-containing protein n=1 Tax=Thiolapillus brandeum TaxID=1076588 RepID=A0A7C5J005_9GAMM|nr:GatB/YqeY domain-containing protein [Thiolapillus brandeum]
MLKERITQEMKAAMKGGDKARLGVIRLILAALKQVEVDERTELDDNRVIAILDKMVKQRRDSVEQYEKAGRTELADQEKYEISVIQEFLPQPLSEEEIEALIEEAIAATGATSMKEMGKVMGMLKPKLQGRADMGAVSGRIKQKLSG